MLKNRSQLKNKNFQHIKKNNLETIPLESNPALSLVLIQQNW